MPRGLVGGKSLAVLASTHTPPMAGCSPSITGPSPDHLQGCMEGLPCFQGHSGHRYLPPAFPQCASHACPGPFHMPGQLQRSSKQAMRGKASNQAYYCCSPQMGTMAKALQHCLLLSSPPPSIPQCPSQVTQNALWLPPLSYSQRSRERRASQQGLEPEQHMAGVTHMSRGGRVDPHPPTACCNEQPALLTLAALCCSPACATLPLLTVNGGAASS